MDIQGMEGMEGAQLVQDTFLFQFLNFDESLALSGLFRREKRKKGEVIIEEGELGRALYVIEKGKVLVTRTENGREEKLAELGKGELFGEMSLIEDELTSATVTAMTSLELMVIDRADLEKLMDENRDIAIKVYKTFCHTLSDRLRRTSSELSRIKAGLGGDKMPRKKTSGKSGDKGAKKTLKKKKPGKPAGEKKKKKK